MLSDYKKFYIFQLTNINLFPKVTKPLNISEPRHIEMVNESIRLGVPIALGFVPEGSLEVRPVAGFSIPRIIEKRPDGSMLVFMVGQGKALLNLQTIKTEGSAVSVEGVVISEDYTLDNSLKTQYVNLSEVLVRWVTQYITDPQQREIFIKGLVGHQEVIGAFAAYLIHDYDMQYEIMELRALNDQIKFLYRLLESGKLTHN